VTVGVSTEAVAGAAFALGEACVDVSGVKCSPNQEVVPRQVKPDVPPQVASVETPVGVAAGAAELTLPDDVGPATGGVKTDVVATRPEEASRYQFV